MHAHYFPTQGRRTQGSGSVFFGLAGLAGPSATLATGVQAGIEGQDWKDENTIMHPAPALKEAGPYSGSLPQSRW